MNITPKKGDHMSKNMKYLIKQKDLRRLDNLRNGFIIQPCH